MLLRKAGREGTGPGEFRSLNVIHRCLGDSIAVVDNGLHRVSILDHTLRTLRTVAVPRVDRFWLYQLGALPGGTFLAWTFQPEVVGPNMPEGRVRLAQRLYAFDAETGGTAPLADVGGEELFVYRLNGGIPSAVPLPFSSRSATSAGGNGFVVVQGAEFEIRLHDRRGELESIVRRVGERRQVPDHDVPEVYSSNDLQVSEMPAYGRHLDRRRSIVLIDSRDRVWVLNYHYPIDAPESWDVFDVDGSYLGGVQFPPFFSPTDITHDRVAGVWRDEMDVEHVRVYELIKP